MLMTNRRLVFDLDWVLMLKVGVLGSFECQIDEFRLANKFCNFFAFLGFSGMLMTNFGVIFVCEVILMLENEIVHLLSVKLTGSGSQKSFVTFWLFWGFWAC